MSINRRMDKEDVLYIYIYTHTIYIHVVYIYIQYAYILYIYIHTIYICIYVDNVYYSAIKNEQNYIIFSNMNGRFILSEVSQKQKEKYHVISLICRL